MRETEVQARTARRLSFDQGKVEETKPGAIDPDVLRLQLKISEQLGCKVSIEADKRRFTVCYHNLDILDGILSRLGVQVE